MHRLCGHLPQHFLNFLPDPQGHGSFGPTFSSSRWYGTAGSAGRGVTASAEAPAAGQAPQASDGESAPESVMPRPDPGVPYQRDEEKVGPNDPCPCGSGKKFKKCCGK